MSVASIVLLCYKALLRKYLWRDKKDQHVPMTCSSARPDNRKQLEINKLRQMLTRMPTLWGITCIWFTFSSSISFFYTVPVCVC